jgi:hypothetical protein
MEIELQSLFGLLCTAVLIAWLRPHNSPSPRIWAHEGAIGELRWTTSLCNLLIKTKAHANGLLVNESSTAPHLVHGENRGILSHKQVQVLRRLVHLQYKDDFQKLSC